MNKIICFFFLSIRLFTPLAGQDYNPMDYDAVGNGEDDDTNAVQAAINDAILNNGGVTFPQNKIFAVTKIVIRNGIKYMQGGEIKFLPTNNPPAGFNMVGKQNGFPENVKNFRIENITFDHNDVPSRAIFGQNVSRININNCIFKNRTTSQFGSIAFLADTNGEEDMMNNSITNNEFYGVIGIGQNISIQSRLLSEDYASSGPGSYWEVHKSAAPSMFKAYNTLISDNIIDGGYYGINTVKAVHTIIQNNSTNNNIRSLSLQHDTNNSIVRNNNLSNPHSSSITLARGSSHNLIENNTISTNNSEGEAMLQAYLGCSDNTFRNNTVSTSPNNVNGRSPRWMIYVAVHCNNNIFEKNTFTGTVDFAYIGIETAWDSSIDDPSHRAIYAGTETDNYANEGMTGIQITNNIISPANNIRRILITEVQDQAGSFYLSNSVIENNTIVNEPDYCIEIISDGISSFDSNMDNVVDQCEINFGNFNPLHKVQGDIQIDGLMKLTPQKAPSNPILGLLYYDANSNKIKVWDGTQWRNLW